MLEFKKEYHFPVKHTIEIIVDNARTHTAQLVNINDFRLNPNGNCPLEILTFIDDNGVPKGLKKIAFEFGYDLPAKIKI